MSTIKSEDNNCPIHRVEPKVEDVDDEIPVWDMMIDEPKPKVETAGTKTESVTEVRDGGSNILAEEPVAATPAEDTVANVSHPSLDEPNIGG
ncbi:hypothetical protein FRC06_010485 [Ceratobasidium sp. 370]|nr:hypothetical protein FRC06_010485 [Ceratobasidium sp. 370]